jgi:hypothetical protein
MLGRAKWSKLAGAALIAALLASACTVPVTQQGRQPTDRSWSRRPRSCRATAIIAARPRHTNKLQHRRR